MMRLDPRRQAEVQRPDGEVHQVGAHVAHRARAEGYPNADAVMRGGLLLGCHQGIGDAEVDTMCAVFDQFAAKF